MSKLYSAEQITKTLEAEGFAFVSQRGSHAKYRKTGSPTLTVIVTDHPQADPQRHVPLHPAPVRP